MTHPYERLTPDCVVDCVEAIGLRSDLRLLALNSYENRVYQVGLEDADPVIVKFYRPERWTRAQILEEHAFAQELVDNGLSVVAPMPIHGDTLHEAEGFLIAAFLRRGGHAPELDNFDHLLGLGRTLGRMHGVGRAAPFHGAYRLHPGALVDRTHGIPERDMDARRAAPRVGQPR